MVIFSQSLYSKWKNAGKSRLTQSIFLNRIHKHSFRALGADTLTFLRVDSVSGEVGWGAVGFLKGYIEVTRFLCTAVTAQVM
jgi:hypothetical protein